MSAPERNQRIAELVESALERDPREWTVFLDEACRQDGALRAEVESLLRYEKEAYDFIEAPAFQVNAETFLAADELDGGAALKPGQLLGDYKILSLLGEGGMGEVYLAEDAVLGRRVAIKQLKRELGTQSIIRHFRQEKQILAGLNDPHIARLYNAAITPDGLPYFVMEYVEGERLDEYCNRRALPIKDRMKLFVKVCSAVAYAHQHLVIHRDIKPANIWVTSDGEPKLLDFGIAKLLDPDTAQAVEQTITLRAVMTPEYASPEQIRGESMTTASDVYSLGVVLYELLTGEKPYRTKSRRPEEISRLITEQEPVRPSTALKAGLPPSARKGNHPNPKSLRGDLDNIVLMAMRKEPSRRYSSVGQFAEDIRRHLEGLPVIARKDIWSYRASKFLKRNKVAVLAVMLVLTTLVAGIIATTWQARVAQAERAKAERRFNEVRKLANSYLFEFHDAIEKLPGSTAVRALLVKRALEYLDSLAREATDDPSLQREVLIAYLKVGNVQGNPRNANLGDSLGAMESYHKALAIGEKLSAVSPDPATRHSLALIFEKMADVEANNNHIQEAVYNARKSLAIFKELAGANPTDVEAQRSLAISRLKVGDILGNPNFVNLGNQPGAMESYRAARKILESLHAADPADAKTRRFLGMIHERIGTMLELQKDVAGALSEYQMSAEIRVPLAAEFTDNTPIVRDAAIAYEKIANTMSALGNLDAALENRRKSLEMFSNLLKADPKNAEAQHSLAISHILLADLLGDPDSENLGRRSEAFENYQHAAQILEALTRADAANEASRRNLTEVQRKLQKLSMAKPDDN